MEIVTSYEVQGLEKTIKKFLTYFNLFPKAQLIPFLFDFIFTLI